MLIAVRRLAGPDLLAAVHERLRELAGIAIAIDPQTLLVRAEWQTQ